MEPHLGVFDRESETSAPRGRTPSEAAARTGTTPSCVFPQFNGSAPVAVSPADSYRITARTILGRRFRPVGHSLGLLFAVNAMAFAVDGFVGMGPLQTVGAGRTLFSAGCIARFYPHLST